MTDHTSLVFITRLHHAPLNTPELSHSQKTPMQCSQRESRKIKKVINTFNKVALLNCFLNCDECTAMNTKVAMFVCVRERVKVDMMND